jgi:hypothetical protein
MPGEAAVIAWLSDLIVIILLALGIAATNLFWLAHWYWWVPAIARKFTWLKRHKRSVVAVADDAGRVHFDFPEEILPEGVLRMKDENWHFLPRPQTQNPDGSILTARQEAAVQVIQRRFILQEMGLPFWIGYAGRLPLMNPMALAAASCKTESLTAELDTIVDLHTDELVSQLVKPLQDPQEQNKALYSILASLKVELNRSIMSAPPAKIVEKGMRVDCHEILSYTKTLPMDFQGPLLKFFDGLNSDSQKDPTPVTYIDPSDIKKMNPRAYTPTQVKALAKNRERYGELKADRGLLAKYGPIIAVILALGIFLIVVFALAYQYFHPPATAKEIVIGLKQRLASLF